MLNRDDSAVFCISLDFVLLGIFSIYVCIFIEYSIFLYRLLVYWYFVELIQIFGTFPHIIIRKEMNIIIFVIWNGSKKEIAIFKSTDFERV